MIFSVLTGFVDVKFNEVVKIILSKIPFLKNIISLEGIRLEHQIIIWKLRIPRVLIAALTGASLSVAGAVYQGIFRNPMADPFILGISSGAAFGASVGILFLAANTITGTGLIAVFAFAGAFFTVLLVFSIARVAGRLPTASLLLAGIAVSFLFSSLTTLIMVYNRSLMERVIFWTMGSFNGTNWNDIWIIAPVTLTGYILIRSFSRELDIMTTGDEAAKSVGVDVEKNKKMLMTVTTLMVSVVVSVCGVIGFVGLIVPHITRLIFRPVHKVLLPFSALFGAILMVLADTIARNILPLISSLLSQAGSTPSELPVGSVTALFGAPFFIWLLIKGKRRVS